MLKTTQRVRNSTNVRKLREPSISEINDSNEIDAREMEKNLSKANFFETGFFISEARIAFTCLSKAFTKAQIVPYFGSERYI